MRREHNHSMRRALEPEVEGESKKWWLKET